MKLNHVGIEIADLYKMEMFYRKVFNFEPIYRYCSKNTFGLKTALLRKEGTVLELLQRKRDEDFLNGKRRTHQFHISFFAEDVQAEYGRIKSISGGEISGLTEPRVTGDGFLEFTFLDPEGNVIEVGKRFETFKPYAIKAIVFDLDGTLIDSEKNYYLSDKRLLEDFGINLTLEMKQRFVGIGNHQMISIIKQEYGLEESVERLTQRKNRYYLEIARHNSDIFPEMKVFVDLLKRCGFPIAIASGSSKNVLDELILLLHLDEYCDVVVSADDVKNGKPAPDIFLAAAEKLGVPPENCLVVEDSKYGVEAAKRAFMYCMAIPYITDALDDNFIMADYLCPKGMRDFDAKRALDWIKSDRSRTTYEAIGLETD
jgi:beta-phosphoglucomutase family hydrolase